ncbi:transposase [Streptomyces sp. ML-6]|nr:transposase [Streptomyces sp. ML-6]MDK0518973.1 transposase [Streptomyces sp. ML-6]
MGLHPARPRHPCPPPRHRPRPRPPAPARERPRQDRQHQARGRKWYVVLACDNVPTEPLPATGAMTGIDMGVTHFATTSEGAHIENPRHAKRNADALADAQRALKAFPRRKRENRSAKHRQAVEKVARLHRKVRRQRLDHAHKTALALVRDYDRIAHEQLRIANMVRTPRPKPDPERPGSFLPNGATSKAGLNRSILDAGWGVFLGILTQKAESAARIVIPVDPRNTSRTCPECGHVDSENRDGEKFQCTACGHRDHADRVGAWNVALRAGLVLPDAA